MRCRDCAHARRFSADGIFCVEYGMIIREGHECTLPGAKEKPADGGTSADQPGADERSNYA